MIKGIATVFAVLMIVLLVSFAATSTVASMTSSSVVMSADNHSPPLVVLTAVREGRVLYVDMRVPVNSPDLGDDGNLYNGDSLRAPILGHEAFPLRE